MNTEFGQGAKQAGPASYVVETNEEGFRWEKELLLRAFFSLMIYIEREKARKKSNVSSLSSSFADRSRSKVGGKGRYNKGWFDLFVLAIRESLLIYDDAFLFFFNFFLRWKYGDDWQR